MIFNERRRQEKKRLTWVINERLYLSAFNDANQWVVGFVTSNGKRYAGILAKHVGTNYIVGYAQNSGFFIYDQAYTMNASGTTRTWTNEASRTITFDEEPTGDLLTWLEANATPQ